MILNSFSASQKKIEICRRQRKEEIHLYDAIAEYANYHRVLRADTQYVPSSGCPDHLWYVLVHCSTGNSLIYSQTIWDYLIPSCARQNKQ